MRFIQTHVPLMVPQDVVSQISFDENLNAISGCKFTSACGYANPVFELCRFEETKETIFAVRHLPVDPVCPMIPVAPPSPGGPRVPSFPGVPATPD